MLKIENLSASYKTIDGNIHVVKDVDFEIRDNEIFGIAGESGCGKSTLLKTLYDIVEFPLEIDKGRVVLSGVKNGKEFSYQSGEIRKCWWNNISYVPQAAQSVLNPIVRLKEQFLDSIPDEDKKNETEQQTLARVAKYLEELGLSPDVLEAFPFQLSGGLRQRVMIAMVMAVQPSLLIADEPTTALDVTIQKQVLVLLNKLKKDVSTGVLFITHDLGVVAEIADRVVILYAGCKVEEGSISEIFADARHPYTIGLMKAVPDVDAEEFDIQPIPGVFPNITEDIGGCRFHPRCPYATERCRTELPEELEVSPGHTVSCHHVQEALKNE